MAFEPEVKNCHVLVKNIDGEDFKDLIINRDIKIEVPDEYETATIQCEFKAANIKEELEDEDPEILLEERSKLRKRVQVQIKDEDDLDDEYLPPSVLKKSKRKYCTRKHLKERLHVCKICGRSYFHPVNLKLHMKVHQAPVKDYRCDTCGRNMGSPQSLREHKRNHLTPRTKCNYCKLHFDSTEELRRHQGMNKCIKHHSCDGCGQLFMREYSLHQHQRACPEKVRLSTYDEGGSDNLVVNESACNKSVYKTYSRKNTISVQPSVNIEGTPSVSNDLYILSTPRTKCKYCKLHFDSTEELRRHQGMNKCIKHYSCDGCGQLYMREYNLYQHQRVCPKKVRLSTYHEGDSEKLFVDKSACNKNVYKTYSRKKNVSVRPSTVNIEGTSSISNDLYILST